MSHRGWTYAGIAVALFGIPAMTTLHRVFAPDPTATAEIVPRDRDPRDHRISGVDRHQERESPSFLDRLSNRPSWPLLGMGHRPRRGLPGRCGDLPCNLRRDGRSLWRGAGHFAHASGYDPRGRASPGISEEVLYRGYAIERLQSITGSKWIAAAISLILFAAFHFRQGLAGVVLAFVLGAILTAFYLWKRNLVANITAHFLVDFIPNVLLAGLGLVK